MKKINIYLYNETLNKINGLGCYFDYHQLWGFFTTKDYHAEFRLGGKFGFGFKIKKNGENIYFTQYLENATPESNEWIKNANEHLKSLLK